MKKKFRSECPQGILRIDRYPHRRYGVSPSQGPGSNSHTPSVHIVRTGAEQIVFAGTVFQTLYTPFVCLITEGRISSAMVGSNPHTPSKHTGDPVQYRLSSAQSPASRHSTQMSSVSSQKGVLLCPVQGSVPSMHVPSTHVSTPVQNKLSSHALFSRHSAHLLFVSSQKGVSPSQWSGSNPQTPPVHTGAPVQYKHHLHSHRQQHTQRKHCLSKRRHRYSYHHFCIQRRQCLRKPSRHSQRPSCSCQYDKRQ